MATGQIDTALNAYRDHGAVSDMASRDRAITALAEDYLADMTSQPNDTRLALAHRRKDVFALNQAIRAGRLAADHLDGEVLVSTDHGPRAFAAGDRIVFTRNDATLGVRNGMLGTIETIRDGRLLVRLDGGDGRSVTFNPEAFPAIDHGYAVSIHKSQGCTVDRSFVLGSRTMDHHLTYVALTRHKKEMQLHLEPSCRQLSKNDRAEQPFVRLRNRGPTQSM